MFHREDWRGLGGETGAWEAVFWGYDETTAGGSGSLERAESSARLFPDAGLAVLRTRTAWLLVTNGETGTRSFGNHKHNDLLSFEFHAEGGPWIVDPGSYVYTGGPGGPEPAPEHRVPLDAATGRSRAGGDTARLALPDPQPLHPEHLECGAEPGFLKYRGLHRGYARSAPKVPSTLEASPSTRTAVV